MSKISDTVHKALCMGRLITVYSSDETATSIEAVKSWSICPGGTAGNMAFALARLGTATGFIGCVGNDDPGLKLKETLVSSGIDARGVRIISDSLTGWIWSLRIPNGNASFHSPQLSFENFADSQLSSFDIDPIWFDSSTFFIPQALVLGPERSRSAILYAKELVEKVGGTTFFDMNFRRFAWQTKEEAIERSRDFAKTCEFIQISLEDCQVFFGVDSVQKLSPLLPNARGLLLTKGAAGCQYLLDGNIDSIPGINVQVADSSLGGDVFFAAFISKVGKFGLDSLSNPDACKDYVRFANAAGALAVTKQRSLTAFPMVEDIENFLSANAVA